MSEVDSDRFDVNMNKEAWAAHEKLAAARATAEHQEPLLDPDPDPTQERRGPVTLKGSQEIKHQEETINRLEAHLCLLGCTWNQESESTQ